MNLSFNKTRLGFDPLDKALGGIYFNEPTLISGPRNSGKVLFAAQFAAKILQTGERLCVMGETNPNDFFLNLQSVGVDVGAAVGSGQLLALSDHASSPRSSKADYLPFPEAIEELRELVTSKSIAFIVFNTVVPWVAVPPDLAPARVEEFVSATEDLQITSLLLLPKPASPAAISLRDLLADRCPVAIQLSADPGGGRHVRLTHYRGSSGISLPVDYLAAIVPGKGFAGRDEAEGAKLPPLLPPSEAARPAKQRDQQHRHHALLTPTGANAPGHSATPFAAVPPPVTRSTPFKAHQATHHRAMLNPQAPTQVDAPAKAGNKTFRPAQLSPAPQFQSAPAPSPAPQFQPAPTQTPQTFQQPTPPAQPARNPQAPATPPPRARRFSAVIK